MMSRHQTDNPDLHLSVEVEPERLEQWLQMILASPVTVIYDLVELIKIPGPWLHLRHQDGPFPQTLTVYGVPFSINQAKQLAQQVPCQIITDYALDLKPQQWQLIAADGQVSVVVLEEDEDGILSLANQDLGLNQQ